MSAAASLRVWPPAQQRGAEDVGGQVAVAEAEPGLAAQQAQGLQAVEGVAPVAPAAGLVDQAGQGVGDDVQVRADVEAEELVVIAGIDDDRHLLRLHDPQEALQEAGAADAAGKNRDQARLLVALMLAMVMPCSFTVTLSPPLADEESVRPDSSSASGGLRMTDSPGLKRLCLAPLVCPRPIQHNRIRCCASGKPWWQDSPNLTLKWGPQCQNSRSPTSANTWLSRG